MDIKNLREAVDEAAAWATRIRRELHRWPEIGNEEDRTATLIEACLDELAVPHTRVLSHTVVGTHRTDKIEGRKQMCLALRADIDALKIQENTTVPFKSQRKGYMHSCGHDVHTAVLLGTARVISEIGDTLNANLKYIFQQDEEGDGKGKDVAGTGVLDDVDTVLGLHVKPELPAGSVGLKYGKMHAASLMVDIIIVGRMSHGACPHKGADALHAAAHVIAAASGITGCLMNPVGPAVVSFGKITGGTARNVIADHVDIQGIIRGEDERACEAIAKHLFRIAEHTAAAWGCNAIINLRDGYPALVNDDETVAHIWNAIRSYNKTCEAEQRIKITECEEMSMTVDDFAYYTAACKGAYFYLGSGFSDRENSGVHTSTFLANEDCIRTGIAAYTAFTIHACGLV